MKLNRIFYVLIFCFLAGSFTAKAQDFTNDNKKIESMLAKKREYNKRYGYGFRIQLYNGLEKRAKSLRGRFRVEFPTIYTKLRYDAPEWKIQVGNYKTRLDADKALVKISEKFSGAIVVPAGE